MTEVGSHKADAAPIASGTWYHLAATLKGTNATIYVNGAVSA
jgi:hypothetical protein